MATQTRMLRTLNALGERVGQGDKKDLTVAVSVVNDLTRVITTGAPRDIRVAQAGVAALRERLDSEPHPNSPAAALEGNNSHAYLAGALWAINEMMTTQLDCIANPEVVGEPTRRELISDLVLRYLREHPVLSQSDLCAQPIAKSLHVRADEVSRAATSLVDRGLLHDVPAKAGTDKRRKYFALTNAGKTAAEASSGDTPTT